jgi:hypothetical protein
MSLAKFNATSKGFICHASPSNLTKKLIVNGRMNLSLAQSAAAPSAEQVCDAITYNSSNYGGLKNNDPKN